KCAAEMLNKSEKKVLFLCFNTYLCSQLKADLDESITVNSIHNFMRGLADDREPGWFEDQPKDKELWDNILPEKFKELLRLKPLTDEEKFDVLIIDEAQDMEVGWLNALKKYLVSEGQFFLFYDKRQNIFGRNFILPQGEKWVPMPLNNNYRNTVKINNFINRTIGTNVISNNVPEGEEVKRKEYSQEDIGGAIKR